MNDLPKCRKCGEKPTRPAVVKRKMVSRGKDLEEKTVVYNTYSCKCGNSRFSGNLDERYISKETKEFPNLKAAIV